MSNAKVKAVETYLETVFALVEAGETVQMFDPYEGGYRDVLKAEKDEYGVEFMTDDFHYGPCAESIIQGGDEYNEGEYEFDFGFVMTELFRFDGHV